MKTNDEKSVNTSLSLKKVSIFSQLSTDEIDIILPMLHVHHFKEGDIIFEQGDESNDLYIVEKGIFLVKVLLRSQKDIVIAEVKPENVLGEIALFTEGTRSATCVAKTDGTLLTLTSSTFQLLQENYPEISIKILYEILAITAKYLDSNSELLSDMVHWGENARKRSITDEFTEMFNRRFLDESLADLFLQAKMRNQPFTIIMADLDHFSVINKEYGHSIGDEVIKAAVSVFKKRFREKDILARYGGDEFTFVLPQTTAETARTIADKVVADVNKLKVLKDMQGSITAPSTSQGIASFPEHAGSLKMLLEIADKALYVAKEQGRNQAVTANEEMMKLVQPTQKLEFTTDEMFTKKEGIQSHKKLKETINNIINNLIKRKNFLIIGHLNPDSDCICSMTAMALVIRALNKRSTVCTSSRMSNSFIVDIWKYNSIAQIDPKEVEIGSISQNIDTVIICDTPKPSMLDINPSIRDLLMRDDVLKIEIDHHVHADSKYSGNDGYNLVQAASSSSLLVSRIVYQLSMLSTLLAQKNVSTIYPRAVILTLLMGMIGDTHNGQFIPQHQEKRLYHLIAHHLERLLKKDTYTKNFISSIPQIEKYLYTNENTISAIEHYFEARIEMHQRIGCLFLDKAESHYLYTNYDTDTIIAHMRKYADILAKKSNFLSLIGYYDETTQIYQYRSRCVPGGKNIDLREFLKKNDITNGGGHKGAIAFRFPILNEDEFDAKNKNLLKQLSLFIKSIK